MVSQLPALSSYETQINALGRFLQSLREASTNSARVEAVVDYLCQEVDPTIIWVGLYDPQDRHLYSLGGTAPVGEINLLPQKLSVSTGDILDQVFLNQRPVGIKDLPTETQNPELLDLALKFALQGCGLFPIRDRNECRGVVIIGWQHQNLPLHPERLSCFSIAFKELGTQLEQTLKTGELLFYRRSGSLPELIGKLANTPNLESRLNILALEIQTQLKPLETRIFWFEPQQHIFVLRASTTLTVQKKKLASDIQIAAADLGKLYQDLRNGQSATLFIGIPTVNRLIGQLLSQPHVKCVFFTPIVQNSTLLGFIATGYESDLPITEIAQTFIKTAATLISLMGRASGSSLLHSQDSSLQTELLQAALQSVMSYQQGPNSLKNMALTLCHLLQAKHFSLLHYDPDTQVFGVAYQLTAQKRQLLPATLGQLSSLDWDLVAKGDGIFQIEHWGQDLRLLDWRESFGELGIQSVLVCRLKRGHYLEGILLIGSDTPRTWNEDSIKVLTQLSESITWQVSQWRSQHIQDERNRLNESLIRGFSTLQTATSLTEVERTGLQWLASTFGASAAGLVTWQPSQPMGKLVAIYPDRVECPIPVDSELVLEEVPLLSQVLMYDQSLVYNSTDLPPTWRQYFPNPKSGLVVAMLLKSSAQHPSIGMIWMGIQNPQTWNDARKAAFELAVREIAIARYQILIKTKVNNRVDTLEQLNWYKLQKLERMEQQFTTQVTWLTQQEAVFQQGADHSSTPTLLKRRYQELLQSFASLSTEFQNLVHHNSWTLQSTQDTILVASLLKSALERIEPISRAHQLWTQIHNLPPDSPAPMHQIFIHGDVDKFRLVLDCLLLVACRRSTPQGRIDVWPRLLDEFWLELSITDHGVLDAELIHELSIGRMDPITPTRLDQEPARQMFICQQLMRELCSDLAYYQLEDGQILTRLVFPIILKT